MSLVAATNMNWLHLIQLCRGAAVLHGCAYVEIVPNGSSRVVGLAMASIAPPTADDGFGSVAATNIGLMIVSSEAYSAASIGFNRIRLGAISDEANGPITLVPSRLKILCGTPFCVESIMNEEARFTGLLNIRIPSLDPLGHVGGQFAISSNLGLEASRTSRRVSIGAGYSANEALNVRNNALVRIPGD